MQASDWSLKTRDSDAPIYLAIFQEIFPNIQDALQKTLSDLETDSLGDDFSLPYTFFLLNVDMELNKNREVFVQKMLEKSQAQLQ
jgi:hypothetical protein